MLARFIIRLLIWFLFWFLFSYLLCWKDPVIAPFIFILFLPIVVLEVLYSLLFYFQKLLLEEEVIRKKFRFGSISVGSLIVCEPQVCYFLL